MSRRRGKQRRRRTQREYSYWEFLVLYPCCRKNHQKELMEQLKAAPRPSVIGKHEVPANLNGLSYGMLDDLQNVAKDKEKDPAIECMGLLLDMTPAEVFAANVVDVFGFINFITEELRKINSLFARIKVKYSSEELQAGVKELDFGSFGVLDWYARRMGIVNQNDVRDVAWVRIYTCMKNDADQNNYERRLRKQYEKKK